jgi:hypothetical protein
MSFNEKRAESPEDRLERGPISESGGKGKHPGEPHGKRLSEQPCTLCGLPRAAMHR